jgi:hypothetical protein
VARTKVQSSNISEVGFTSDDSDEPTGLLEVKFSNGKLYRYHKVPESTYKELVDAESIGRHFRQHIRNGGFDYEPFEEEED